jgi:uncharacterized membrane protein YhaH (DUF805 family)
MNHAFFWISLIAFFSVPPVFVALRGMRGRRFPWWLLLLATATFEWALLNATVYFYFHSLGDAINSYSGNPPSELIERWANDGGTRTVALCFGWLYGLLYLVPWLCIYAFVHFLAHLYVRRKA